MADLLRNDPEQVVPSANAALEELNGFQTAARNFNTAANTTRSSEGAFNRSTGQTADNLLNNVNRVVDLETPRIEAIRQSAADTASVADEGASGLNNTDLTIL